MDERERRCGEHGCEAFPDAEWAFCFEHLAERQSRMLALSPRRPAVAQTFGPSDERVRVARSSGALYSEPRRCARRRRCDGHLSLPHYIEVGDAVVWSALPPGGEYGYERWQHAAYCAECAPEADVEGSNR